MASQADYIRELFASLLRSGDPQSILAHIEAFYTKVEWQNNLRLVSAEIHADSTVLTFTIGDDSRPLVIEKQAGRYRLWSGMVSDAGLSERLGLPVGYIEGVIDAAEMLGERLVDAERDRESAARDRKRAAATKSRIEATEAALTEKVVEDQMFHERMQLGREKIAAEFAAELNGLRAENLMLRELSGDNPACLIPDPICGIPGLTPLAVSVGRTSGIYFLCESNEVVYVGQSVGVQSRIWDHRDKRFSSAFYFECEPGHLDRVEREWINRLLPKYNADMETRRERKRLEARNAR